MQTIEKALHAPMPFTAGGQTITDRLTAAKHSLAGSQLGKSICKATTEECMGPKKKHLDYLLHCTHEPNVSIPQMANLLIERTQNDHWCVVYKSLITIHNLMCYGNERFTQYLASCNANFTVGNAMEKPMVQGEHYDMSTHVRRYGKYISEKVYTYRLCAFDFCKVKRGREDGLLRTMHTEKLLKTIPILQGQVDALLEFQVTSSELNNGVINSSFILLFRDLIRLFACYNDGIINLLEKYFDMNKKQCKEALAMYKTFLVRMDKVAEFLKVAEAVGIDKGEIPDLARAPNSLLEALEQHLNSMDGGKGSNLTSPTSTAGPSFAAQSAITQLSSGFDTSGLDDSIKQKYLQEEQAHLNALKEQRQRELDVGGGAQMNGNAFNPFLESSSSTPAPPPQQFQSKPIDDLLSLDIGGGPPPPVAQDTNPFMSASQPFQPAPVPNYFGAQTAAGSDQGAFSANFSKAFGSDQQPQALGPTAAVSEAAGVHFPRSPSGQGPVQTYTPLEDNTNPFLTANFGDSDLADDAWAAATKPQPSFQPSAMEPDDSSGDDLNVADTVGAELRNPFSAFQQNSQALKGADVEVLPPPRIPSSVPTPTPTPEPMHIGEHPMAGLPSQPSPAPSPQPMMMASAPMAIPRPVGQHLNIYEQTPFSGMDASYTSSPQLPRHVAQPPQGSPAKQQAAAVATEFAGLDPLGDLLTPSSSAASNAPHSGPPSRYDPKLLKGDLDSSLASLAQNLTIEKGGANKPVQWGARPVAPTTMGMAPGMAQPGMWPMYQPQPGWGGAPMMQMPPGYYPQPGMVPVQGMPHPGYGMPPGQQQPPQPGQQPYGGGMH